MLRGPLNPYAVVHRIHGVFDPRANYNEYVDIKDQMRTYNMRRRLGDETLQQELDGVKLKLAAFYTKNPRNPRDEDEPRTDAHAVVYLDDDERFVQTIEPDKLSYYLLYQSQ
jgi:hypothetical protein